MAEQVLDNQTQPAAGNAETGVVKFDGPWKIERCKHCWIVFRDGICIPLTRTTRELAQQAADHENLIWRHRQVEQAAADMLAALIDMVDLHDTDVADGAIKTWKGSERWRRVEAARAALSKAEPTS